MPIHDWSRVNAGIFHDFHSTWIIELKKTLNDGLLPSGYYALAEQIAGNVGPDVLALQSPDSALPSLEEGNGTNGGGLAVATAPPKARFITAAPWDPYAVRQKHLAIRHSSDHNIVAFIEIISPGNKASRLALKDFLNKAVAVIAHGKNLLLLDLNRPSSRDPNGIHGAFWGEFSDESYSAPPDKPLTLAAYAAGLASPSTPMRAVLAGCAHDASGASALPSANMNKRRVTMFPL